MVTRIEIGTTVFDTRAAIRIAKLSDFSFAEKINDLFLLDVYTIDKKFSQEDLHKIGSAISHPITQSFFFRTENQNNSSIKNKKFAYAIEIGFLPGQTDNVSHTVKEIVEDMLKTSFTNGEDVYTSQITFIDGSISETEVKLIAESLYNPIIQRMSIKNFEEFHKSGGMDVVVPRVNLTQLPKATEVSLNISDIDLEKIGKEGIANADGTRRGPLALSLLYMKTIQKHFNSLGRNPTDIEIEAIAQTWAEHCKHTIFNDPIDELPNGLFKSYIRRATEEIRANKNKKDFCVSVFTDNSGAIAFDDTFLVTHKAETHNSPSALDPYGGSITGIVGVNRDTLGFGLGAKPVANMYGFCLADPRMDIPLYKGSDFTQKMLSARRILDGVVDGVNAGGNQSGIPTPQGFLYFDERYRGKPLVFVGTIGLIPKIIKGKPSYIKKALPGDYIVVIGGRVGKDGIHGATFSSEAMDQGSPKTAVQIGDPITQKKLSDAMVKEARDMMLYNSVTDNGAGGISCSVSEMAKESNGCRVYLEKVPLKYPGLQPWEIWVSESQERMTLAVPKKNWKKFDNLMQRRGVEATVIGEFTDSGKCVVSYNGETIIDLDLEFLHNGLPKRQLISSYSSVQHQEPKLSTEKNLTKPFTSMLERLNVTGFSYISQQYDHLVQAGSVLPPLQGRGRVNAYATVFRPVLSSNRGVILSQGLYPTYSDIDTYAMAASSLDTAIRNAVSAGADPDYIALLDNFCWCSPFEKQRLGELKRAAKACYDYATAYQTPFISGKDSMHNDFNGYDTDGNKVNISIPPTLLISSIGIVQDITKVISLDAKIPGDLVYILGETFDELGASEYYAMLGNAVGNIVPKVNAKMNNTIYHRYYQAVEKRLIASGISINRGGLGIALAKTAIGGMLGLSVNLQNIPGESTRDDFALFSETQGRILATVHPENVKMFEKMMEGVIYSQIGTVTDDKTMTITGLNKQIIVKEKIGVLADSYRKVFKDY